ncbi:MAG: pilus assembly protein PilM [Candidatus Magasanikbacteria bacterium]|nr:pilus assembly protein PilM [Candidatus Magasanikbacteria bacterium]
MFLSNTFSGAFGLDFGDLSIKLIQLRRPRTIGMDRGFVVHESRVVPLTPGLIVNGEIEQPELVRKKLLQLLGSEGNLFPPLKARYAIVDLPEPKTFLKLITIDAPPDTLTNDDIIFQAKKHLPFELEETYLDWEIVRPASDTAMSRVLIGATPKIIADTYTYLLESANINPLALEIEGVSIARALITRGKVYSGEARLLLDMGATRSSLIVYDHNTIQFSTTIPFSGELITTALMQQLKMDYSSAEKLKIKNGLTHDKERPKYLKTISEVTDILVTNIKKTLDFYKEHFLDTNPVTHITMCGGLATLINLDKVLAAKLKISAWPGNAWKNISLSPVNEAQKMQGLILTTPIGLALRAAENPLAHIL